MACWANPGDPGEAVRSRNHPAAPRTGSLHPNTNTVVPRGEEAENQVSCMTCPKVTLLGTDFQRTFSDTLNRPSL